MKGQVKWLVKQIGRGRAGASHDLTLSATYEKSLAASYSHHTTATNLGNQDKVTYKIQPQMSGLSGYFHLHHALMLQDA